MSNNSSLRSTGNNLSDTDYAKFPVFVPDSLRFTTTRQGLPARRIPVKLRSEQQSYASNNNRLVRIVMPNTSIYDTRAGYLTFNLSLQTTGGTYKRFHNGIFSIFNRLRILVASTVVEDIQDYNRIASMLWAMIVPPEVVSSIGVNALGFGTQNDRNNLGNQSSTGYACTLFSGVLNTELLPFGDLASGMVIELYLEDGVVCVETDGTVPVYTISNILFHVERLILDQAYTNYISSYIKNNGLQLGFNTWQRYINALGTGSNQQLLINHRSSSMNGMLNILVNSAQINDPTVNDKFLIWPSTFPNNAFITQTNLLINGQPFPDEPIDTVSNFKYEPYQQYCRWIMKWKLNGFLQIAPPITNEFFNTPTTGQFVQVDDLEAYPEVPNIINSFTTLDNNSTILKNVTFSGSISNNFQLDSWVEYFQQFGIMGNGSVVVLR